MGFVKVCETTDVPEGKMTKVQVGNVEVLIANIRGEYFAVGNRCTHMGGDLSRGELNEYIITCPHNGSKFDVRSGEAVVGPRTLFIKLKVQSIPTYTLKIEARNLMINTCQRRAS